MKTSPALSNGAQSISGSSVNLGLSQKLQYKYIWICTAVLLLSSICGRLCGPLLWRPVEALSLAHPHILILASIRHRFHAGAEFHFSDPQYLRFFFTILIHNECAIVLFAAAGSLLFFFPSLALGILGLLFGLIFYNEGAWQFTMRILPHSIVEIPATLLIAAAATQAGWAFAKAPEEIKSTILRAHVGFVFKFWRVSALLLVLAAALESYGRSFLWTYWLTHG